MKTCGVFPILLAVSAVHYVSALCPNGIAENTTVSMMNFSKAQFGQIYMWDCELETEATKSAKECSTANAGASKGSFKFSLSVETTSESAASVVDAHFSKTIETSAKTVTAKEVANIGCGFAECKERVDVVCLFKNTTTV